MCNGEIIFVCPLSQFLLVVSFTLLLSLLLPSMGHQQAAFPQEGPALV